MNAFLHPELDAMEHGLFMSAAAEKLGTTIRKADNLFCPRDRVARSRWLHSKNIGRVLEEISRVSARYHLTGPTTSYQSKSLTSIRSKAFERFLKDILL